MNFIGCRFALRVILASVLAIFALAARAAEDYPSRPIRLIVGFGAGGTGDAIARFFAARMSDLLKVPVIVDNRPSAGQLVAINAVMRSPTDGYWLYLGTGSSLSQNPAFRKDLPYDPLKDFAPVGLLVTVPAVLFVGTSVPAQSVRELVAHMKANPGKLNYGSAGVSTAGHLSGEAFLALTGTRATHIAYKADAEVLRETMAGTIQFSIMPTVNTVGQVRAGKVRALAVTAMRRLPYMPDVPSLAETGVKDLAELEPHVYHTIVGPAGMAPAAIAKLNETINRVLADPEAQERLRNTLFIEPAPVGTPEDLRKYIAADLAKWSELAKQVRIGE